MWPLIFLLFVSNIFAFQRQANDIYNGCGETRTCFGIPDNCIEPQTCTAIATVVVLDGRYLFEMQSGANNVAYVSMAFSSDDQMGDDAVMECLPEAGTVRAFNSWNFRRTTTREGVPQDVIQLLNASFIDGTIYCHLEREPLTTILEKEFDLVNTQWHLMVAIGNSVTATQIGLHNLGRISSSEPVYLAEVTTLRGRSEILFRLHGAFMLVAWIGAASVGILLARYFKQTFVGSQLLGKDQWFAWHRLLMIATWLLTIVGFILIFVEVRGWSTENPHAVLGTISTILCFIQPFMATFRPGPTHKYRPVFNWAHLLVGNAAYGLAIVTIFFAVPLFAAQLPQYYDWILTAFVVFNILIHVVLTIMAGIVNDKKNNQLTISFATTNVASPRNSINELDAPNKNGNKEPDVTHNNSVVERKMDAPYSGLRKAILSIYLLIVLGFVIALVVIAAIAPGNDI